MNRALPIKTITNCLPSKEEFKLSYRNKPTIICDGLKGHPCENLSLELILSLFADQKVSYSKYLDGGETKECTLSYFVNNFFLPHIKSTKEAVRSFSSESVPNLIDILIPPSFCEDWFDDHFSKLWRDKIVNLNRHLWLFMSQEDSLSSFHQDHHAVHTCLMQIEGKKEVVLFNPEESEKICDIQPDEIFSIEMPDRGLGPNIKFNDKNLLKADQEEYFSGYQPYYGVLKKGEVLYLPSGWGHFTKTIDRSITVSRDMIDERNADEYFFSYLSESVSDARENKHNSFLEYA